MNLFLRHHLFAWLYPLLQFRILVGGGWYSLSNNFQDVSKSPPVSLIDTGPDIASLVTRDVFVITPYFYIITRHVHIVITLFGMITATQHSHIKFAVFAFYRYDCLIYVTGTVRGTRPYVRSLERLFVHTG